MSVEMYREPGQGLCLLVRGYPYIAYPWLRLRLVLRFGLSKHGAAVAGFHRHFQYYRDDRGVIGIGWDLWRGCFIHAQDQDAEPLVQEIGSFLNGSGYVPPVAGARAGTWHNGPVPAHPRT